VTVSVTNRLVVLRHAKAEPHGAGGDLQRPLALRGRRQASAVGRALLAAGVAPEAVLCSPALRTRQTWELASAAWAGDDALPAARWPEELYDARVEDVLELLAGLGDARTVVVVGHEPTVSSLAAYLAGEEDSDAGALAQVRTGVPTATWSVLESAAPWGEWSRGSAVLQRVVPPGE